LIESRCPTDGVDLHEGLSYGKWVWLATRPLAIRIVKDLELSIRLPPGATRYLWWWVDARLVVITAQLPLDESVPLVAFSFSQSHSLAPLVVL
jgi:hypothetical protein